MTNNPSSDDPASLTPELIPVDVAALRCLQVRMMQRDVAAGNTKSHAAKELRLQQFVAASSQGLRECGFGERGEAPGIDDIVAQASERAALVDQRSRAVAVLIELMVFNPWPDTTKWDDKIRQDELAAATRDLAGASMDDLELLVREFAVVMKQLRRKSIRWGRVAAVTAVGLGAGIATGGMAAPAVGAAIGGTLGLSGAAATSAGLAMLGGGSLAAGGLGVAGGTMLITGIGGVAAAGAAGAGIRYSRVGSGVIAVDAVKVDLMARAVLAQAEDRDQKIRRIVESLHLTVNELAKKANVLTEHIIELKEHNRVLREENNALRARISRLRADLLRSDAELNRLRAELEGVRRDRATVEVVLDRLPTMVGE